jgi:phage-related protein
VFARTSKTGLSIFWRDAISSSTSSKITVLHAFVKKTQKTPRRELLTARERLRNVKRHA